MRVNLIFSIIFILASTFGSFAYAQSSMTDTQVLEYIKEGIKQGKEQKQLASELARKGVDRAQAERVRELYERQTGTNVSTMQGTDINEVRIREKKKDGDSSILDNAEKKNKFTSDEESVFGRNIFNTKNLTFEPSNNIPTPPNYQLGPGDEIIIDIWGASQSTIRQIISPDGTVSIQELGPIYINGLTVSEASVFLKNKLGTIYSNDDNQIRVTLGNIRTIQVNVMGEVVQPGTYTLSAFSNVFYALYRAGGINSIGSLRNVQLIRRGKLISSVDVYDFIMQGKIKDDINLQEGDVINVPTYHMLVKISGNVKRAMKFEMKQNETLETLIQYAGGFNADAYRKNLRIVRQNGEEYEVKTISQSEYSNTLLKDGDVVTIGAILDRFTNKIEVRGAVYRPDIYELNEEVKTVSALVKKAKGLMDDAFTNRAVLQRKRDDMTSEILPIDIKALMEGKVKDISLRKNDVLYIPSIHDLKDLETVNISGEVARPNQYPYADNMTLEDLIIQAGGLKEAASTVRVDVSRRIKDSKSLVSTDTIGIMYSFSLKDGFIIDGEQGFTLKPYDHVFVRRSPGYQSQKNVTIIGEVVFEGTYSLTNKAERISQIIKKTGGTTKSAYLKGARLKRLATLEEKKRMMDVVNMMKREYGENLVDSLGIRVEDTYNVAIDLEEALSNPGGDADIVINEGDVLVIPEYNNTIKINGAVMVPNTVSYKQGEGVKYYLNQAGGYSQHAKKSKKYIVYMNGRVTKVKGTGKSQIEPGCEIIIPNKKKKNGLKVAEIIGVASAFGSLGTMAATIGTLLR